MFDIEFHTIRLNGFKFYEINLILLVDCELQFLIKMNVSSFYETLKHLLTHFLIDICDP